MVLVDTSVLSVSFRRRDSRTLPDRQKRVVRAFVDLSNAGEVVLLGIVRQELLSGVRHRDQYDRLRGVLDGFAYLPVTLADHDFAAECFNTCRAGRIAAGDVDMLIAAAAIRQDTPVFTTDADFEQYARHLPLRLHAV